ncbi:hypothetical protein Tco_0624483 [Tanacetum coccineum]|uniref:Uncharacterized protein n=1 Tax=Tanacetum coccineum TaxID=301880 RepID=A0ABQ4WE27_9ASTR
MSQPDNDEFSQHLSDEESNHEDASDTGSAPKQQQQMIPQTTAISNIKLPILKKEEMELQEENFNWKGWYCSSTFTNMEAIRTRLGGNANSKKMQKAVFKQQFEAFKISNLEGLEKGYDRFQQLLSQLEAHGAEVSTEDANHKFLRSLPPACSCTPSTSSTNIPEKEVLAGFADEVIYSLFAKQSEDWDLLHEDLEQIDDVDIEEMDINWQIAMIAIRMKKFYKENKGRDSEMYQQRGHMRKEEERHNLSHQEAGTQEQNQMVADNRMMGFVNWG